MGSKELRKMILEEYGSEKEFLSKRLTVMKKKYKDIVDLIAPGELKKSAGLIKLFSVTRLGNEEIYNPSVRKYLFSLAKNSPTMNAAHGLVGLNPISEGDEGKHSAMSD